MMYVLIFFTHCTGIFGFKNIDITRTISVTNVTQSTCQVDFETINDQPTTSIQLMTTPTNMITVNDTFGSSTDSVPLAAIIPSVVGGIVGLCVIFICILGFIIRMKYRKRQKNYASTLQPVISRYVYIWLYVTYACILMHGTYIWLYVTYACSWLLCLAIHFNKY